MIGQTISHYKILEKLGEGGMGIVYKAHDTKLDRNVALKFLPRDVSLSEEERTRFIHEAKAASALEHPNICTIHEVDETSDGQMYIVMGYYEGRSISKMVEKSRLDVAEAVSIAIQIAEGLQAAHEKGIVHRDIKSSNIIVSDKGQVRILDFGLARRKGLSKLTKTGTTVGTALYMSPEQAQGESIDHRTDLWSLGVVLYEMITGKLPFKGEHEAAILYSVVNEEPQPIQTIVPDASSELIHILRWALEKDPAERYQSAADLLTDLRRLKKDTSRSGFPPVSGGRRKPSPVRNKLVIAAGVLVLLCVAGYLALMKRGAELNPDMIIRTLQIPLSELSYPGISGDGNWIAFCAKDHGGKSGLYFKPSTGDYHLVVPIPSHLAAGFTDLSPDGSLILQTFSDMHNSRMFEYIAPSMGGTLQKILEGSGGRFRPDGKRVGYIRGTGNGADRSASGKVEFWSAGIDGSDPRLEFIDSLHIAGGEFSLSYSPDGKKLAWLRTFPGQFEEIVIHDLETGQERTITSDKKRIEELAWVRGDQIVYTTDRSGVFNVWMVPAAGGTPVPIFRETVPATAVKCSADGQRMLYLQLKGSTDLWIVDIAKNRPRQITFREELQYSPSFSPNGNDIAFIVNTSGTGPGPTTSSHIFIMDRNGDNRRQLSFGDETVSGPVWSPDGRRIAYGSQKLSEPGDSIRTYVLEPSNPGSPMYVTQGTPDGWFDSARILVVIKEETYIATVDGAPPVPVYDDSTRAVPVLGGRYILFHDHHQGKDVGVWIVDGTKPRDVQRKTARLLPWNSHNIEVSGDGKTLYSLRGAGQLWRMALPDGKEERIRADFLGVEYFPNFSPSWDGKEILITKRKTSTSVVMIENLFK